MLSESCPDLLGTSAGTFVVFSKDFGLISGPQNWIRPQLGTSLMLENSVRTIISFMNNNEFEKAVDFMLNEVHEHAKVLATQTETELEDFTDFSSLIETLKQRGIISEEELDRLTVLQMALDGLDMQVHECGAAVNRKNLNYLTEFVLIIKKILARKDIYVGITIGGSQTLIAIQGFTVTSDLQSSLNFAKTTGQSSFCTIAYAMGQTDLLAFGTTDSPTIQ